MNIWQDYKVSNGITIDPEWQNSKTFLAWRKLDFIFFNL